MLGVAALHPLDLQTYLDQMTKADSAATNVMDKMDALGPQLWPNFK